MKNKEISHVEIYYADSSMERISNEKKVDKKLTKKQIEWIIKQCLSDLNNLRNRCREEREVTINNYNEFDEDIFLDISHNEYQMLISLLNTFEIG